MLYFLLGGFGRCLTLCWPLDCIVEIKTEGNYNNRDSPVLQPVKASIEEEDVEDEMVDHLQVVHHLQLAGVLVLEGKQPAGLRNDHTQAHSQKHDPVDS